MLGSCQNYLLLKRSNPKIVKCNDKCNNVHENMGIIIISKMIIIDEAELICIKKVYVT